MGLIDAIGDWVLDGARPAGPAVDGRRHSARRSGSTCRRGSCGSPTSAQRILGACSPRASTRARSSIEITESAAMSDPDRTQRVLRELHERGLRLAIDDFGTGYSSLSRLKYMPVDILKIDRSFVKDIPGTPTRPAMVRAIIQIGRSLGMTPLAEGIETEEQWRFLVDAGLHPRPGLPVQQAGAGERDRGQPPAARRPAPRARRRPSPPRRGQRVGHGHGRSA